MATRTTVQRTRRAAPSSLGSDTASTATANTTGTAGTAGTANTAGAHALIKVPRGERPLQPAHLANARVLGPHTCACMRSPRAIAHWLLCNTQPSIEPTELALDREEAALWSNTLTGRLKIEHTAIDGTCALHLGYADGRSITIAMDELRLASVA